MIYIVIYFLCGDAVVTLTRKWAFSPLAKLLDWVCPSLLALKNSAKLTLTKRQPLQAAEIT
ncbi:hypothetical protein L6232_13890 [Shewanella sp. C31]|nr:hypothetical protein [Shewanella electrica]